MREYEDGKDHRVLLRHAVGVDEGPVPLSGHFQCFEARESVRVSVSQSYLEKPNHRRHRCRARRVDRPHRRGGVEMDNVNLVKRHQSGKCCVQ